MLNPKDIFPIGIGTWGIGGFAEKDPNNNDKKQINAIRHMLDSGMNYLELVPWYAEWGAVEIALESLKQSKKKRVELFVTGSIYHYRNETLNDARIEIEKLLRMLDTDKLDSVMFLRNGFTKWGVKKSIGFLSKILDEGITNYVSLSNCDIETLKFVYKELGSKLFAHEIQHNFEVRFNVDYGLVDFANENGIRNVVYQPIRRNRSAHRNWPLLIELSKKYDKTQNQLIMNWLMSSGMLPITKSENIDHIDELLGSLDFEMEKEDLSRINEWRPDVKLPKLAWNEKEDGLIIHQLSNSIDDIIDGKYESKSN